MLQIWGSDRIWQNSLSKMSYKIYYYVSFSGENPVQKFLDSLSEKQQVKVLRIIQYIRDYGLIAVIPHTKKLKGTPLWEIRILGKDNIRIIYVIPLKETVLLLHGFIKKSQKTSSRDLDIAITRYQKWKRIKS